MKLALISLLFVTISFASFAQNDFNFYADSIQLYAIGEDHRQKNAEIQIEIIDYINSNKQIDYVFIELPHSFSETFNSYVLNGKDKEKLHKLLDLIPFQANENIGLLLRHIAEYNRNSPNHKVRVQAVDQFGFGWVKTDAKALSILYPELDGKTSDKTQKLIFNEGYTRFMGETEYFELLLDDLFTNYREMESILGEKIEAYEKDLREGVVEDIFDLQQADYLRELHITEQMAKYMSDTVCAVTINGASHVTKMIDDSWFNDYPFSPALSRLTSDYRINTCSIVLEYPVLFRGNSFNLLTANVKELIKASDTIYTTINPTEIRTSYPFAANRCDVVILCDI